MPENTPFSNRLLSSAGINPYEQQQNNKVEKPPYLQTDFNKKLSQNVEPPKSMEDFVTDRGMQWLQRGIERNDMNAQMTPYTYNAGSDGHSFYDRYAAFGQEKMDKIGFSPFKNNDAAFNAQTSFLDRTQRSIVHGFIPLFARGFVSAPKSLARMMQGDFGDDPEDARKYAEAAAIAQDTAGGVGAFFNNSLMNFGYTAGIIGEAITEELAITGLTGGVGGVVNLPRFGVNIGRAFRGIKGFDTVVDMAASLNKSLKSLTNINKAREFFSAAKIESALATKGGKIANFFNPAENLLETGLEIAKNTKQLQGWNRFNNATFKTAGALYRDVRNINMAVSEARLEAGFTRNDTFDKLIKDYQAKHNGALPSESLRKAMMTEAEKASKDTLLANSLLIFASNKVTFNNVMNPKSGLARMMAKKVSEVQKMAGKTTVREFTKKTLKSGKELLTPKLSAVKGTLANIKKQGFQKGIKGVIGYTKANLMEGVQEVLQEVIADTSKNYHLQSFYSQPVGYYMYTEAERKAMKDEGFGNILGEAFGKQASMQGLETFASGFVMGAFASPLNRAIPFVQQKYMQIFKKDQYKAHRDYVDKYVEKMTKSVNDTFAKNPLEFLNSKVFSLGTQAELANVIDTGDTKVERDAKEEATIQNVTDLIKMDSLEIWTDYMESLKELTTEEYAEAVGISVEQAEGHVEKLDKVIGRAKEIEKTYNEYNKKFPNPIDFNDYKKGTKDYEKAEVYHNAWEQARKNVVFYHENYKNTVARMQKIYQNIGNEELLGKIDPNRVQALLKDDRLKGEIQILESEVQGLKGMTDSVSKRKLKQTEATLGILKEYEKDYDNYMDYFYEKGMSKPVVTEAKTETAPEIKADVVQVQNPRKKGYQNSIVKKSESTNESGDKVTEYTAYAVDENGNERKMANTGINTTVGEFAPLVKPEEGDSNAFYDEDGNLKYDPDAEIVITKTIEGKEKDGSYQQRITVTSGDVSFKTGAEATFTSNKNIVVGDTSYKSNLTQKTVAETKTEEATPAERETEIKNKLESSFKNYMKALAKQSDDIILDDSIDVAFTSVLDHYDLGREAGKLADAVNVLNDPAGFVDHVAKTYDWMYEMWNNREEYIFENIGKQLDIIKSNQLLNDMAAIGVYVDLDAFADYQETGVVPTEFFDAINKRVIKRGSPIYDQVANRFMELSEFKKIIKESKPVTKNKNEELAKLDAEEAEEISNLPKVPTRIVVRTLDEKDFSTKFINDELSEGQYIDVKYQEEGVEKTATFFKDQDDILRQDNAQGEVADLESEIKYNNGEIFEIINRPTDEDIAEVKKKYDALRAELLERLTKYGPSASTEAMAKAVEEVKAMLLSDDEYTATRRNYIIKGKAYERMTNRIRENYSTYTYTNKGILEDAYDGTIGVNGLTEDSIKDFIKRLKSEEPPGFEDYTYTELEEELKSLMDEPIASALSADTQAKQADIEKRRRVAVLNAIPVDDEFVIYPEQFDQFNREGDEAPKGSLSGKDIEYNIQQIINEEIEYSKNITGNRQVSDAIFAKGKIPKLQKILADVKEINAKYDAELQAELNAAKAIDFIFSDQPTADAKADIENKIKAFNNTIENEFEEGDYNKLITLAEKQVKDGTIPQTPENIQLLTNYPKLFEELIKATDARNKTIAAFDKEKVLAGNPNALPIYGIQSTINPATGRLNIQWVEIRKEKITNIQLTKIENYAAEALFNYKSELQKELDALEQAPVTPKANIEELNANPEFQTFNVPISKKENIKNVVAGPLLKASEIFWDKNIRTTGSWIEVIQGETASGDYIEIAYDSLSEENKKIADKLKESDTNFGRIKGVRIVLGNNLSAQDAQKKSIEIANKFKQQDLLWYSPKTLQNAINNLEADKKRYPKSVKEIDQEIERVKDTWDKELAPGEYFDKATKTIWASEELYKKSKGLSVSAEAEIPRSIQKELDALNDKIDKLNEQIYDAEDAGNQLRADNLKMRREELYDLLKETSERGKQAVPEIRSDLKNYVVNYAIENTYETAKANGIYLDNQFKAVFDPNSAGPVFDSKYISEEAYNDLFGEDGYITNIKKRADAGEFYIFSTDLIVYTDKAKDADGNPLPPVAGEIDFIFVDREGRKFIVDLKSGKVGKWLNYNDFGSKSYDKKIDNTLQQVGYANLSQLASGDEFQIAIWPVELNYEKTGYINRAGKPSNPNLMLNQKPIGDPKSEPFIINLDKNVKFKMINPEGDGSDVYMTAMEYMEQYVTGPVAPSTKAKAKPKGQAIPQDESSIVDAITNEIQNGNVIKAGMDANMAKTQGTISDASYKYIMGLINEKMNTSLMESAVLAAPGQQFITINDIFAERFDGIISVESKVNAGEIATVESVDEANEEIILVTGYGDRFTVNFNEMNDYIVSPEQLDDKTAPAAPKYEPTQTEIEFTTESMVNVDEFLDDATFRNQATNEADNQSSDEIDNDLYSNLICP
jgi:hypothetical protein